MTKPNVHVDFDTQAIIEAVQEFHQHLATMAYRKMIPADRERETIRFRGDLDAAIEQALTIEIEEA